jgi:hypothetical protein
MIKSKRMKRAVHEACVGEKCIENSGRKTCRKEPLLTPMPTWEVKWILEKENERLWAGFIGLRQGPVVDSCEHNNEHSISLKS